MLAHGANPDAMGEDDFRLVMIALNDGFIGNKQILNSIGSLTAGVFNYIRDPKSPAYSLKTVLGNSYGYIFSDNETSPNDALLTFMTQAKGFSLNKFKKD